MGDPVSVAATLERPGQRRIEAIQRARILAAALQAVHDTGACNLTVADVVARAGVSRRTFYEAFGGVQDCLSAVVAEGVAAARERVLPAYRGARGDWRERFRAGLAELLLLLDERPEVARLLVVEWPACDAQLSQGYQQLVLRVAEELAASAPAGEREGDREQESNQRRIVAEGVVGGVLAIVRARLAETDGQVRLAELTSSLMAIVVLPYLGREAARAELEQRPPAPRASVPRAQSPLRDLDLRLTQRTVAVIAAIAARPGSSNRAVADAAQVRDQGQISKLLLRLQRLGLLVNGNAERRVGGGSNAWRLTELGEQLASSLSFDRVSDGR